MPAVVGKDADEATKCANAEPDGVAQQKKIIDAQMAVLKEKKYMIFLKGRLQQQKKCWRQKVEVLKGLKAMRCNNAMRGMKAMRAMKSMKA